ncbi:MAG: FAD-binding oxidoreductase, partial [Elusimicrobiales bacterium]|nr:FAD-binding oxidoreductase [Elusimicrobiales bacterium]
NILNEVKSRYRADAQSVIVGSDSNSNKNLENENNILSLSALTEIIDLDRENFTVKVEAGIKISRLKELLKTSSLYPALPDYEGTLGGLIAGNCAKNIKNILIGLDIMTSNGEIHSFGGKTLKNVAGYDVAKLFIGSMGAYGIILNATIKLDSKNQDFFEAMPGAVSRTMSTKTAEAMPGAATKDHAHPATTTSAGRQTARFTPGKYSRRLKKVFDPKNLFNSRLYNIKKDSPALSGKDVSSLKDYSMKKLHKQNDLFKLSEQDK